MRLTALALLVGSLFLGVPAVSAQEQRGSVEGVVKDASGAVLPGVTVEAKSPTGVVVSTTSEGNGSFRFPSLQPGTYTITASLSGFQSRT